MKKAELIKAIVPATKRHWENLYKGKTYSENHIYNAIKNNTKSMLKSRYDSLKNLGYIN